ncbi:MAG: hypothetical protein GKC10_09195 [Methanosarcinales archaeon]|nr:hypothetical protein [Methanosarcinales archaeon]
MSDLEIFCPSCDDQTPHSVIKSAREDLVKCEECGTVHPVRRERTRLTTVKVIVSRGGTSRSYQVTIPAEDELVVGQEMLVDDGVDDVVLAELTSLETDKRERKALAGDVRTAWARAVDQVVVKVAVQRGGKTRSFNVSVVGTRTFRVGDVEQIEGTRYLIKNIKLREGSFTDSAEAKDIVRIWGRRM